MDPARERPPGGLYTVAWEARHSALRPTLPNVAKVGDAEWCRVMVEGGSAVDGLDTGRRTALICAALSGHNDTVQLLVQLGADVNATDHIVGATGA